MTTPTPSTRHSALGTRHSHIVLCGLDRLGFRTLEELLRLGEEVVIVAPAGEGEFLDEARARGVPIVAGQARNEATLRAAGVPQAVALVLTDDDDLGNLHAALAAQELNPRLRVVVRMFNQELGQRLGHLFRDCTILSASALAAPAFVAAALHEDWEGRVSVAGRALALGRRTARDADVLLPLAALDDSGNVRDGDARSLFPDGAEECLCLVDRGPTPAALAAPWPRSPGSIVACACWRSSSSRWRR